MKVIKTGSTEIILIKIIDYYLLKILEILVLFDPHTEIVMLAVLNDFAFVFFIISGLAAVILLRFVICVFWFVLNRSSNQINVVTVHQINNFCPNHAVHGDCVLVHVLHVERV